MLEALFHDALQAPSLTVVALSYLGGVASTLLPCCIGMIPIMVGYMGGYADTSTRADVFIQVMLYIVGLAIVMTALGVISSLAGITFGSWIGGGWYLFAGSIAIVMGLKLLDVIRLPMPSFVRKLPQAGHDKSGWMRYAAPVGLGVAFGLASSPCGTPFLAGVLSLISNSKSIVVGALSLFAYAVGQGTLLLIVGMFTGLIKHKAVLGRVGPIMSAVSGVVFLVAGLFLALEGLGFPFAKLMPGLF